MADMTAVASVFLELVKQVSENNQNVRISLKMGDNVAFEFESAGNGTAEDIREKKWSPSQIKRNYTRKIDYLHHKIKNRDLCMVLRPEWGTGK